MSERDRVLKAVEGKGVITRTNDGQWWGQGPLPLSADVVDELTTEGLLVDPGYIPSPHRQRAV